MDLTKTIFLDGATGSYFQTQGVNYPPVEANIKNPEVVINTHIQYIQAGANIITANTFGAYSHKYPNFKELIAQAIAHAKAAVAQTQPTHIALDIGPTGLMLEPYGDTPQREVAKIYAQTIAEGVAQGVDLILVETMMDLTEMEIAVKEAKKTGLPVFATMSMEPNGRTMYGASIADMVKTLENLKVDALGLNCGEGLEPYQSLIDELTSKTTLPTIFQPNAGLPQFSNGVTSYTITPTEYATFMANQQSVTILGGCCGTTPAHIQAMVQTIGC